MDLGAVRLPARPSYDHTDGTQLRHRSLVRPRPLCTTVIFISPSHARGLVYESVAVKKREMDAPISRF